MRVVVIGGGLAGMAATVALWSAGADVTLLESRRSLGGRAGSFEEPGTGDALDNCQHILLGCCTNLIDFYRRMGALHRIDFQDTIIFCDDLGRLHRLRGAPGWPAPLHLAGSLMRFGILTGAERLAIVRAMLAMLRTGRRGRAALSDVPFGRWLDERGQGRGLIEKFYDPILVSALNEQAANVAASYAVQVFQEAMLAHSRGYVLGVPACTLGELYRSLPGGDVRLGQRVESFRLEHDHIVAIRATSRQEFQADAVVLATGHHSARRLVPDDWAQRDLRFASLDQLQSVPILGVHLWFDRPVMPVPHAALLGGPLQWLFRKDFRGCVIHGVISAARDSQDVPRERLVRDFELQIRSLFPAAREARLLRSTIIIEKRATFAPTPGVDRFRPAQAPPPGALKNLFLAGDYTQTGWPATMEGAVRSGYLAADAVLAQAAIAPKSFVVQDLPIQWPAAIAGL